MANALTRFFATGADQPVIGDQAAIDATFRRHRLRVMLAITVGYAFAYTCRLALSVVKKPLIDEGIFSPQDLGLIGSALFFSYAFAKLVNGFLADHANIKIFFATGVIASALINIGMGFSTILWVSVALWALNGWFQGFGAPSGAVSLTAWFSNRERGRFYGIWSTAHSMGEGLTYYVVALFVAWLGWRAGFWVPGFFCVLAGLWIYALMQDRPRTLGLPTIADWKNDHLAEAAPKEARVLTLFGKYAGSVKKDGFHWANPLLSKKRLSLRVRNFESSKIKVNDHEGNPIEIAAVVVWRVVETAEASFEVDNYEHYVKVQTESAVRNLATQYPYDAYIEGHKSLRANTAEIAEQLKLEIVYEVGQLRGEGCRLN